ncbi:MAG: hypothetical protein AB199_02970 [Parcubacteria bacterium C7867-004]|nr:MAG: hypothetical protein AB199_02970 [Parcubacteria bacterium C7867-004]
MDPIFLLALIPLVLWASSNFIDKILLSKYFPDGSVSILMAYSGLFGIVAAPIYLILDPAALSVTPLIGLALFAAGLLSAFAVWLYLYALTIEDTSTVLPFFQTTPIFGLIFGFLILNETITTSQALFGALIILGGMVLAFDIEKGKPISVKWKLLGFVLSASALFALYEAVFKLLALEEGFWISMFWQSVSLAVIGIGILLVPSQRRAFFSHMRSSGTPIFGLNIFNEFITGVGTAAYNYLVLLAPIALVMLTHVYQSVVVFVMGLLLSLFLPGLIDEKRSPRILVQKISALILITISSVFLFGS